MQIALRAAKQKVQLKLGAGHELREAIASAIGELAGATGKSLDACRRRLERETYEEKDPETGIWEDTVAKK